MAWVVAPNIKALFASVNRLAPNRDKASDGTIGDLAHQSGTSGHNPDDMAGVRAERSDADSIQEVRAGDIDRDLRLPDVSMENVVQTVVKTPNLRKRLIYVIYNRRIWSASNGWRQAAYTGSNPHDKHAHFSGHPDYDNDSSPWREIEALGEDVDMTPEQAKKLDELHETITRWRAGMPTMADGKRGIEPVKWRQRDEAFQASLGANVASLAGKDWVDEPAIVQGVLAGLTPAKIAAAIPEALTEQVAEELARRMTAGSAPPQG